MKQCKKEKYWSKMGRGEGMPSEKEGGGAPSEWLRLYTRDLSHPSTISPTLAAPIVAERSAQLRFQVVGTIVRVWKNKRISMARTSRQQGNQEEGKHLALAWSAAQPFTPVELNHASDAGLSSGCTSCNWWRQTIPSLPPWNSCLERNQKVSKKKHQPLDSPSTFPQACPRSRHGLQKLPAILSISCRSTSWSNWILPNKAFGRLSLVCNPR